MKDLNIELPLENSKNEKELLGLIRSGDAILMVGAGSSMIIGYPSWPGLIKLLENAVEEQVSFGNLKFDVKTESKGCNMLEYADKLKVALGSRFETIMDNTFREKAPDECHKKLISLPFRGILTTNYDPTLETAIFEEKGFRESSIIIDEATSNTWINKFFQGLNHGAPKQQLIAHLHGVHNQPKSIVLGKADYMKKYGSEDPDSEKWTLHKRIIWALMATRRIVYIGFSMTDPFFQMVHQISSKDLGHYGADIHYMITRLSTDNFNQADEQKLFAKKIQSDFGIQTVFFEDDKSYGGLKNYILELYHWINQDTDEAVQTTPSFNEENITTEGDTRLTDKLEQLARKKNQQMQEDED